MLDSMTPEAFAERWAHYLVEPWGDEWYQTGTIAAAIDNAMVRYAYGRAGKRVPANALTEVQQYVPKFKLGERDETRTTAEDADGGERFARQMGLI